MIVGDAVSFPLSATTGTPPLTYRLLGPQATCEGSDPATAIACPGDGTGTVVDPDWPAGLTFDAATRTLSGTLAGLGSGPVTSSVHDSGPDTRHIDPSTTTAYTYLATDSADPPRTSRATVQLTARAAPLHFDGDLPSWIWKAGVPIAPLPLPRITNAPGPLTYEFRPALPAGLTFHRATHVLAGRPTHPQTATRYAFVATEQTPHPRSTEVHASFTVTAPPPPAARCSAGRAGGYPCRNIDLMAALPLADIGGGEGKDIWGWTDTSTGKEYAIMGRSTGTAFVDISDPVNPRYLGNLPLHGTASATHYDVKVYQNHAFIVTEAANSGMQVFDLTGLRNVTAPPATFAETAHYAGFSTAHNIVINEASGFAYAVGTDTCDGGLHMINIQTPTAPTKAGCFSAAGYIHDAQCVNYAGPDADYANTEVCFNATPDRRADQDALTIVDVTDKAKPVQISRTGYRGARYAHQGWLTEDQTYFLLGDEHDEGAGRTGGKTRTHLWNVQRPRRPAAHRRARCHDHRHRP